MKTTTMNTMKRAIESAVLTAALTLVAPLAVAEPAAAPRRGRGHPG